MVPQNSFQTPGVRKESSLPQALFSYRASSILVHSSFQVTADSFRALSRDSIAAGIDKVLLDEGSRACTLLSVLNYERIRSRAVAKVLIVSKEGLVAIDLLLNVDYFFVASEELIGYLTAVVVELTLKRDTLIVCEKPVNNL